MEPTLKKIIKKKVMIVWKVKKINEFWQRNRSTLKTRMALLLMTFLLWSPFINAQSNNTDFMRNIGKMYVVVAVILAIFFGIILFLIYLDRKISRLEKQIEDNG
ncbi:MAG: CcmD family protein [Polaribacter sp.]